MLRVHNKYYEECKCIVVAKEWRKATNKCGLYPLMEP